MAEITAALVKDLRERTGAGMMDCKKALNETGGDMEAAIDWLRKKGLSAAAKKSGRVAAEGLVGVASAPSACSRVLSSGAFRLALICALSLFTTAAGVPAGATTPYH